MGKKVRTGLILMTAPQAGGGHQYANFLVSLLLRHREEYEFVAFGNNAFWGRWCRTNGIRYVRCNFDVYTEGEQEWAIRHPVLSGIHSRYLTPMGRLLRKEKIKLLICCLQGVFLPNYRVKLIYPVHDLMHRYEPSFEEVGGEIRKRDLAFGSAAKFGTAILVDSHVGRKQFTESYLAGVRRKPWVRVLPFTVPQHVLEGEEEYIETPHKYIFYPAQFWKHKNHLNLIKAVSLLKTEIPDIHLVLVGSEKNALGPVKKFIKQSGLEGHVTILGFVSDRQVVYLYRHAVGMVMPSYFGPTNIPPLEAMALGCPVAVSNRYAMPEQVGEAGMLFDPDSPEEIADCISEMWKDGGLREKMVEEGYRKTVQWKDEDFEKKFMDTISIILKRR